MEKKVERKSVYGKSILSKALKERLSILTKALAEADIGGKGIDIVKEIKELHTLLDAITAKNEVQDCEKKDAAPLVVVWGTSTEHPLSGMTHTLQQGGEHDAKT